MVTLNVERSGSSDWGYVHLPYNNKTFKFPCYFPTKEIFNFDPDPLIRLKCTLLTVGTPVFSVIRSIYWLGKAALMCVAEAFRYMDELKASPTAWEDIKVTAYDSVRALAYSAKMTGYAFLGIFAPFWARRHYGQLERELNKQTDGAKKDMFYLAICFQRLACLPDDQNFEKVQKKLIKRIEFEREFQQKMLPVMNLLIPGLNNLRAAT